MHCKYVDSNVLLLAMILFRAQHRQAFRWVEALTGNRLADAVKKLLNDLMFDCALEISGKHTSVTVTNTFFVAHEATDIDGLEKQSANGHSL